MKLGSQLTGLRICPHCGAAKPVLLRLAKTDKAVGGANGDYPARWAMYKCTTCGDVVLAKGERVIDYDLDDPEIVRIYPQARQAHEDIPDLARGFLQQAYDTLHAPDAAGVMAASAVDAMLKEMGYSSGSLYTRIDKAVADHKLTADMGEWAHNVRLGANRPRHADENSPNLTRDEAKQSVDFAEALGQFLFVLAAQVRRGLQAAQTD